MGDLILKDREDGFEVVLDEKDGREPTPIRTIVILEGQDQWRAYDRYYLDGREPPKFIGGDCDILILRAQIYNGYIRPLYKDNPLLIDRTLHSQS